ncbi:T6SS effector phospholipase Tle3 domain-containing protein [Rubrivivax gelatinosus]|uniref:Uncharacterized protein n=1 Tax=Rubrivivax gelatinosus (strain NBRC 100245 / IL144) TaxID=983917 RepID=I0HSE9_RUBGI|nr:DUF3274 domain-containing protein [Rubrivivax gelatinosus]BAL95936.1 hypothetical protein RGE_25970 [Rubrivivax gelatinosus IL144]
MPTPGSDRDNRSRVFLYCNPHDQVIGVAPVQGIGWRGVNAAQLDKIGAAGVFHQRVWAMPGGKQSPEFAVGSPDWTGRAYRYRDDNHDPSQFWLPRPPMMRFALATTEEQGFFSKIVTFVTAPFVYIVTRMFDIPINATPPKEWAVPITAPALPQPVTPMSTRYGKTGPFDEGKDPARDAHAEVYQQTGQGTAASERSLRYEQAARLKRLQRAAAKAGQTLSAEEQRSELRKMMEENPNATDHSTILTNALHAERVLAYDVAIGWVNPSRIKPEDVQVFRQFAHWMFVDDLLADQFAPAQAFASYWQAGFYEKKQLHLTYTMQHMAANAPASWMCANAIGRAPSNETRHILQ